MEKMERVLKKLKKSYLKKSRKQRGLGKISFETHWDGRSLFLIGDVDSVQERYEIGSYFAKHCKRYACYKGLVNDITVKGEVEKPISLPSVNDSALEGLEFDVVVVGAGVVGCSIARELSKYQLSIAVVEKENDCAMHASSRNDGMIHPGFADNPKTIKGRLNTRGNRLYHQLDKELGFETKWPGSFLLFKSPFFRLLVPLMHLRAKKNGVDGDVGFRPKKWIQKMEPNLQAQFYGGFWMPSAGIASPFRVTIAFAENAAQNGVRFFFETAVVGFEMEKGKIVGVKTNRGAIRAKMVINAAGLWADKIADFAQDRFFSIHPRKGMDLILDKKKDGSQVTIIGMPDLLASSKNHSKGGGVVPCVEGNILVGPTAYEVYDREDYGTDKEDIFLLNKQLMMNKKLSKADIIAYYGGTRAASWEEDFIVEASERVGNLIYAAAIQSPGFASAPAIAQDIVAITLKQFETQWGKVVAKKEDSLFQPYRKAELEMAKLSHAQKNEAIQREPLYGKVVCRCEQVSEGEIRDAVVRCKQLGLEKISVDAVKRRCRAGMGRCHGGFCTPRVMEIISSEVGSPLQTITKKGGNSFILSGAIGEDHAC